MSKWTEEKIKKQIVVGNFLAYKGDVEIVKGGLETSSKLLETYNIVCDNSYKYVFNKAEDWQFYKDYECTMEILPEPIKVKKKVKFYRYFKEGKFSDHWYAIDERISTGYFKKFRKLEDLDISYLTENFVKTSLYVELEIEVEE